MNSESREENSGGKTVLVAGKVSNETYKDVEEYRKGRGLTRSQVVADAVGFYVHSIECIKCGALNPEDGLKCSVCGKNLYDDAEIFARMHTGLDYPPDSERFKNIVSKFFDDYNIGFINQFLREGYSPTFGADCERIGGSRQYRIILNFEKNGLLVAPAGGKISAPITADFLYELLESMGDDPYIHFSNIALNKEKMSKLRKEEEARKLADASKDITL